MKAILRSGFLALAIMAIAVPANAGPFEDGEAAYERGDYATAIQMWRPLAEQGSAEAQFMLGGVYGKQRRWALAVKWMRMSAQNGFEGAQGALGILYFGGFGVSEDFVMAHMWFNIAAANGEPNSRSLRETAAKRMTPDQIAEAQRMAREWMAKHQQ